MDRLIVSEDIFLFAIPTFSLGHDTFTNTKKTFVVFLRTLFHTKPELSDELLERTGVDPTLRPNQVNFEDYEKICRSFLEVSREHDMPITPLRVRKPVAVATRKLTGVDIHTSYQITQ